MSDKNAQVPARGNRWDMEICASPVPGGMSTTRTSNFPQAVPLASFSNALITCEFTTGAETFNIVRSLEHLSALFSFSPS